MKLLGWMHHKFRQNSSEPLNDLVIGPKSSYGTKTCRQTQRDHHRNSFAGLEATQAEEENYEEEASAAMSELFHGFLAIGTLGSEHIINSPSTPAFTISLENLTKKESEVTESQLQLLNDKLEKVLGAEIKEEIADASSGRNSHVSTGRSSNGSTITLSGKALEVPEINRSGSAVCPLQGYLFRSAIELPEATKTTKKGHRTSLRELFQRTKIAEENVGGRYEKEEKQLEKDADKSAVNIMKRMLKEKVPNMCRSSTTASGGTADSASAETKLNKILHMFHMKFQPKSSTSSKKHMKLLKRGKQHRNISSDGAYNNERQILTDWQSTMPGKGIRCYKSQSNPQFTLSSDSNGNREFWIKTDANYLVLEL